MRNVLIEDLLSIGNKYLAANIASRRARQLNAGERPRIKTSHIKPATIALEELAAGALEYRVLPHEPRPDRRLYPAREVDEEIAREFKERERFIPEELEAQIEKEEEEELRES
ncbi:DNA-directed RNA polymerase subunit omega [Candidatus Poribacteria bacterium]|nr:MAG: DNA-directed RNA polymerase subunit omega [Candidatus Poribacteria bacterium]